MPKILLVSEQRDGDVALVLESELRNAFSAERENVRIELANSYQTARDALPGDVSLVITPAHLRKTLTSALSLSEMQGVELIRRMQEGQMRIPVILIAPTFTDQLRDAQPYLGQTSIVYTGCDMINAVVKRSKELVYKGPSRRLDVEIHVKKDSAWSYRIIGDGFGYASPDRPFIVDQSALRDLKLFTAALGQATENWQEILRAIGESILDSIGKDSLFHYDYIDGLSKGGYDTTTRVRFVVGPELHGVAFEAVLTPRRDKFWMLEAPIYRRLVVQSSSSAGYLFEGRAKCLIINAAVSGSAAGVRHVLDKLTMATPECRWLEQKILEVTDSFNMAPPEILSATEGAKPTPENVRRVLESDKWDIVHFAGHSYHDGNTNKGYVFLPGEEDDQIEKVELERFGDWLHRTTLVYMSSCDSGTGAFVFELANRQVPNIIGFRWRVGDRLAFEYAQEFYGSLFKTRSIEKAFLKARQEMNLRRPESPIWASSVLIKQFDER